MKKPSVTTSQHITYHLSIGVPCYILFAVADISLTLQGLQGEISREGNPVLRYLMHDFGVLSAMLISKGLVFLVLLLLGIIGAMGVAKDADWLYWLTLPITKRWMKRKKRYWIPFVPIYLLAFFQALAAASWYYLLHIR